MKNPILIFSLGIFVTISIAATTVNNYTTIKPDLPKSIVCKELQIYEVSSFVSKYTKQGYIVKSCNGAGHSNYIVIMEKY